MTEKDRVLELLDTAYRALGEVVVLCETEGSDMPEFHKAMIQRIARQIQDVKDKGNEDYFDKAGLVSELQKSIKHHYKCLEASEQDSREVKIIYTSIRKHREKKRKMMEREAVKAQRKTTASKAIADLGI
jgi:hypothetical protein